MKLVEILAKELEEWPEGAACVAQDSDATVWPFNKTDIERYPNGQWGIGLCVEPGWDSEVSQLATDHTTAIVTREMWEAERAKNNNEPVEWDGKGMPPVGARVFVNGLEDTATVVAQSEERGQVCVKFDNGVMTVLNIATISTFIDEHTQALREMNSLYIEGGMAALWEAGYRKVEGEK